MAQKQIKQLQQAATSSKSPEEKRKEAEKRQKDQDKAAAEQARKEAAELFKPTQTQKVPFGVDPKTVLCQFFKKGACDKGNSLPQLLNSIIGLADDLLLRRFIVGRKCKFSHDMTIERKTVKRSLYTDTRDGDEEEEEGDEDPKPKDDMADWDEEKLRSVVLSKHGNPRSTTDKVCKYFIDAVENGKYGWFWQCPNGGDKCMYKHNLPPG